MEPIVVVFLQDNIICQPQGGIIRPINVQYGTKHFINSILLTSEFKVKGIIRCKIPFSSCLNKGVCTHPPYNDKKSTQCFLIPFLKSGCSEVPVRMM